LESLELSLVVAKGEPAAERLEHTDEGCEYVEEQTYIGAEEERIGALTLHQCLAEKRLIKREIAEGAP
jgi:hypothetical protein